MRVAISLAMAWLALVAGATPAHAGAIRQCTMPDGSVAFTEIGCPGTAGTSHRYALAPPAVSNGSANASRRQDFAEYRQRQRFEAMAGNPRRRETRPPAAVVNLHRHQAAHRAPDEAPATVTVATADPRASPSKPLAALTAWVASARAAGLTLVADKGPQESPGPTWTVSSATRHAGPGARRGAEAGWD